MYSITKDGQDAKHLCDIDEENRTVSTIEDGLVFDFSGLYGWTFNAGSRCTFKTGSDCTFDTGNDCIFKTGCDCIFETGFNCAFITGSDCSFITDNNCTFDTLEDCTFKTGNECVVIRRDKFEVFVPPAGKKVTLLEEGGFKVMETTKSITLYLTEEQIESLKAQGIL